MSKKRLSSIFALVIAAFAVTVSFQNCAKSLSPEQSNVQSVRDIVQPEGFVVDAEVIAGANARIALSLNKPVQQDIPYSAVAIDGTATAGTHFPMIVALSGTISAGNTSAILDVPTNTPPNSTTDFTGKEFTVRVDFGSPLSMSKTARIKFIAQTVTPVVTSFQHSSNSGAIAGGYRHFCALKGQALYCQGNNGSGQLGTGNTTNSNQPVLVSGFDTNVQAVANGTNHTCAIRAGALYCWGLNSSYQLGNGLNTNSTFPVAVNNMTSDVTAVSLGTNHSCAIKAGALYCWGANPNGEVGHALGTQQVPYKVPNFDANVTAIMAGNSTTCAVRNGGMYCWGANGVGQSGIGSTTTSAARNPTANNVTSVLGMDTGVTAISSHGDHVCAIKAGSLYCWGQNGNGQLGLGNTSSVTAPNLVAALGGSVTAIATSRYHTCAIKSGRAYCWGNSNTGQLGYANTTQKTVPDVAVPMTLAADETVDYIAAAGISSDDGQASTCAKTNKNRVLCWGYNGVGQLGDGTTANKTSPVALAFFN